MIAACPKCSARYRVDPQRLGAEGARLKCARCSAVFRVRPPEAGNAPPAPEAAAPAPTPAPRQAPPAAGAPRATAPAPAASEPASPDPERLVVIADPDAEEGKRTATAVASWGLQPVLVHDGVEAMLTIQRMLPRAVVLDAALPKMYGFQVCEVVKRNDSLRHTTVALVGAIHHKDRYRRPPHELYGADVYLERPDLPDGLRPLLEQAGLPVSPQGGGAPAPSAQPPPQAAPAPAPAARPPAAPAPAASPPDDGLADQRAKAERLARIVVSDIVLYNAEKFEAAAAAGNVLEAMDGELEEGRALFAQRVDARVREERDFLADELRRVAAERAGR